MIDRVKTRLARRSVLKQTERRTVHPWQRPPSERRVLAVLPAGEDASRDAWRFVKALGLSPDRLTPIVLAGEVTYVPAEYVHHLVRLDDEHLNVLGLPRKAFAQELWDHQPDLALALSPAFDLPAALLVGASPAPLRIGFFDERAEPFYDLMVAPSGREGALEGAYEALKSTISRLKPPALALPT